MRRKPFILSVEGGWMIYDYGGGVSAQRRDGDGNPLLFSSRDEARRFLGLAPGRRDPGYGERVLVEDIGGGDVGCA